MKLGFNDLIEAYNEFKFIQSTYKGEKTDWYEVHLKLYNLMKSLNEDVRQSGNYNPLRAGKPTVSTVRMIVRALFNCRYKFDYHLQM